MAKRKPAKKPKRIPKKKPRVTHKLTDRVKREIKAAHGTQPLKNYDGEARIYLRKYKSLKKARAEKAGKVFKINGINVPRNSELYTIATALAARRGITVSKLSAEDIAALAQLGKDGRLFFNREVEYIKQDIKDSPQKKVIYNNVSTIKDTILLRLVRMKNKAVPEGRLYPYMNIEYFVDLTGLINIRFPTSAEYRGFINMETEQDTIDAWRDLLDTYEIGYTPND